MTADIEITTNEPLPLLFRIKFAAVRGLLWLVAKCLSLKGLYLVGQVFGTCEWLLDYKRRRRFHQTMEHVFGGEYGAKETRAACRKYFMRIRCDKLYYLIFDLLPKEKIRRRIHFPQKHLLDESLTRGQGLYIALSHLGSQHVAAILMCFLGYKVAGVRDRHESPLRRYIQQKFDARFSEVRAAKIFFADAFPRDIYRWFQGNGLLGSALDAERLRNSRLKKMPVRVFGETREYLTGTVQIALRCGAGIYQGFAISKPNYHYDLIVLPLHNDEGGSGDSPEVLGHIMQTYAKNIEVQTRLFPDHVSKI